VEKIGRKIAFERMRFVEILKRLPDINIEDRTMVSSNTISLQLTHPFAHL
jgi:hypothetical protein